MRGHCGSSYATGVAEIVADTSTDKDYVVDDARRASEMVVPILCDGEVIGVIDSEHSLKGFFQPHHQDGAEHRQHLYKRLTQQ